MCKRILDPEQNMQLIFVYTYIVLCYIVLLWHHLYICFVLSYSRMFRTLAALLVAATCVQSQDGTLPSMIRYV